MVNLVRVPKKCFTDLHKSAHFAVFNEPYTDHSFEFSVMAVNEKDQPVHYYTVQLVSPSHAHISWGGCLPDFRGKGQSFPIMKEIIKSLHRDYSKISYSCHNTNFAMLKFGIYAGFVISGLRVVDRMLYVDHELWIGD